MAGSGRGTLALKIAGWLGLLGTGATAGGAAMTAAQGPEGWLPDMNRNLQGGMRNPSAVAGVDSFFTSVARFIQNLFKLLTNFSAISQGRYDELAMFSGENTPEGNDRGIFNAPDRGSDQRSEAGPGGQSRADAGGPQTAELTSFRPGSQVPSDTEVALTAGITAAETGAGLITLAKVGGKRLPLVGGLVTAGFTLSNMWERGSRGDFIGAGTELLAGGAETVANFFGFGLIGGGDAARELVRGAVGLVPGGDQHLPARSGLGEIWDWTQRQLASERASATVADAGGGDQRVTPTFDARASEGYAQASYQPASFDMGGVFAMAVGDGYQGDRPSAQTGYSAAFAQAGGVPGASQRRYAPRGGQHQHQDGPQAVLV